MMIVMILCLILSISAAAPLNSKAAEEDLVSDDIGSVNIMNGDYMDDDGIHSHSSQNTDRDARLVINAGGVSIGSISLSGDYAQAKIAAVFSNVASHGPHPATRTSQDRVPAHDPVPFFSEDPPLQSAPTDYEGYGSAPTGYGSAPIDYGSAPTDYGSAPTDYGSAPIDYGSAPTDYGSAPTNYEGYGSAPTGYGSAPTDYGSALTDYGSAPTDYGSAPTDYGSAPTDYGSAPTDYEGISKQEAIKELIGTREKIQECLCKLTNSTIEPIKLKSDQEEQIIQLMTKATAILQNHDYCRIENGNCEPKQMQTFNSIISKADELVNDIIDAKYTVLSHWLLKEFQEQKKTFDEATVQEIQKLMPESSRVCIPGEISSAACVCRSASIYREYEEHCTANQGCTPHGFCFTVCDTNSCTCKNSANEGTENCSNGQICINGKCLNVCQGRITPKSDQCICPDERGFHEYGGEQCPPNEEKNKEQYFRCRCSGCELDNIFIFFWG